MINISVLSIRNEKKVFYHFYALSLANLSRFKRTGLMRFFTATSFGQSKIVIYGYCAVASEVHIWHFWLIVLYILDIFNVADIHGVAWSKWLHYSLRWYWIFRCRLWIKLGQKVHQYLIRWCIINGFNLKFQVLWLVLLVFLCI